MTVSHIVLFSFKSEASAQDVDGLCSGMLALKDKCVRKSTNTPYIKSMVGGLNFAPEQFTGGIKYGFVVEFESKEDLEYYGKEDPAHQEFVKSMDGKVEKAQVIDFAQGVFK